MNFKINNFLGGKFWNIIIQIEFLILKIWVHYYNIFNTNFKKYIYFLEFIHFDGNLLCICVLCVSNLYSLYDLLSKSNLT